MWTELKAVFPYLLLRHIGQRMRTVRNQEPSASVVEPMAGISQLVGLEDPLLVEDRICLDLDQGTVPMPLQAQGRYHFDKRRRKRWAIQGHGRPSLLFE